MRDDENFTYVAAWEWKGPDQRPRRSHKEDLEFENVALDPAELQVGDRR